MDILEQLSSDRAKARRVTHEVEGADVYEITTIGTTTARRKLNKKEVKRLNILPK